MMTFLILAALSAPGDCSFKGAVYKNVSSPGYSLTVEDKGGAPMLRLTSSSTGAAYRFGVTQGNGYSAASLTGADDGPDGPASFHAHVEAYAMSSELSVSRQFPQLEDLAPQFLIIPSLGQMLWYEAENLGGPSTASGVREALDPSPFERIACGGDGQTAALAHPTSE